MTRVVRAGRWTARCLVLLTVALLADPATGLGDAAAAGDAAVPRADVAALRGERAVRRAASCARPRRKKRRAPAVTAAYRRMRARWHRPAPRRVVRAWTKDTPLALTLRSVNRGDEVTLRPDATTGAFDEAALAALATVMAHTEDGATHPAHPRLLNVLYRAVKHFRVPYVHVVSGYRPERATSRHSQGRAIDVVFPGVADDRLAAFLRKQGYVGVGIYPVSGFVHLDVRAKSYFWVDRSGPGAAQRTRPMLAEYARKQDKLAVRRGEESIPDADFDETIEASTEEPPPAAP